MAMFTHASHVDFEHCPALYRNKIIDMYQQWANLIVVYKRIFISKIAIRAFCTRIFLHLTIFTVP
jgi:hypothetical protein